MKKLKYLFLIACFSLAFSCEVQFTPNERFLTQGLVVDDVGEPISGAEINVYSRRSTSLFTQDDFLLGSNFSDTTGRFEVTSLSDRNDEFSVEIINGNDFTRYAYLANTEENPPQELIIDLGTITLKRIGEINYSITRVSGEGNSIEFSFTYDNIECVQYFGEDGLDMNQSFCFEEQTLNRSLGDNNPDATGLFSSTFGTIIQFTYSINEQDPITETFTLDQENNEFTFNY